MPVKIRLSRQGRKKRPFYYIVAADSRSKRDGRYLEKLGTYNPVTNPASITLDVDASLKWLHNGAQPTDTAKAILSYKGVMYKKHLQRGVSKGAFSQEDADKKFEEWVTAKEAKVNAKKDGLAKAIADDKAQRLAAEKEINETRAKAIAAANAPEPVAEEAEATADDSAE